MFKQPKNAITGNYERKKFTFGTIKRTSKITYMQTGQNGLSRSGKLTEKY